MHTFRSLGGETMDRELKDYFLIVKRRIWLVLCCVIAACIFAAVYSYYLVTPEYSATTKLVVNKGNQLPTGQTVYDLNAVTTNIKLVNTYKEIIQTSAVLDKVAERYPALQLSSEQLLKKMTFKSANESQVIHISVFDPSYERAANIANAVASVFKQEIFEIMDIDNVTILETAKLKGNPVPVKPNFQLNLLLAIAASLMISAALVFLLEYMDSSIRYENDVELYLDVPLLATVSTIRKNDLKSDRSAVSNQKRKVGESTYAGVNR
jgi:capsular polysaccharide biosynthesis protein